MKLSYSILIVTIACSISISCKKLIEVAPPSTAITESGAYEENATATAVMTGLYTEISGSAPAVPGSIPSITLYAGLSADEWSLWSGSNQVEMAYFTNILSGNESGVGWQFWDVIYPQINTVNGVIDGVTAASSLNPAVKKQLMGEAQFMRAFFYFYLVNLYGDVAMPLNSNYKANSLLPRTPVSNVYRQIVTDLQAAKLNLSTNYLDASLLIPYTERVRPTYWAAAALLSRVFLYMRDWKDAGLEADTVIDNTGLFSLSPLSKVFLKADLGNNEAIWQLQPVNIGSNTEDAKDFIVPATGPGTGSNVGVYLSNSLLQSFEDSDQRRVDWVDSAIVGSTVYYYPYKYKQATDDVSPSAVTEYLMILRLGELYLIRAEAAAQQNDLAGASADLNAIRSRAGLANTTAASQSGLIAAILHERQVELFAELGHRWLDLKRTATVDSVMANVAPQKGSTWHSYQQLYPVPFSDIQVDPDLKQNPGY